MARNGNPIFALLWILLLYFLVWPISGLCAALWLLIQPFEACFDFLKQISDFLEKFLTWPRTTGKAIADCSEKFPAPF